MARHDVGEDDKAHAVADTTLSDELAHPHDEHSAGDKGAHDHDIENDLGSIGAVEADTEALEQEQITDRVQNRKSKREITRILGDLGLTDLALTSKLVQRRHHGLKHLKDDRARDVGMMPS